MASQAAVIDFESLTHNDADITDHGATYAEDGFVLRNLATEETSGYEPSLATFGSSAEGYTGSTALFNDNYPGVTWMTSLDSILFSLFSIDLSELAEHRGETEVITFYGLNSFGTIVSQSFTIDGAFGAETFFFSADFTNLASAWWAQTDYFVQFDNITTSPVPEPSTLLLFGVGLIGLSAATRKRIVEDEAAYSIAG
ncbi:MAG: PEP-CTERM sorting domain-containing protein [Desulfobulbus sp.]|nr:PEP-CTERM sorting domain-containing protein [Desulfobulbus sp.]